MRRLLTVCISQSGETADTLAAQREAKQKGSPTLAICNVKGSMITREAAGTILTHAGPEIGVASTKAFTSQLAALLLLASHLGQVRGKMAPEAARNIDAGVHRKFLTRLKRFCKPMNRASTKIWPGNFSVKRISCILAAAFIIQSRSKARLSSKKFPTFMPKAILPAK